MRKGAALRYVIVTTMIAVSGLTVFHRYAEEKPFSRSIREALSDVVGGVRWLGRQLRSIR